MENIGLIPDLIRTALSTLSKTKKKNGELFNTKLIFIVTCMDVALTFFSFLSRDY